MWNMFVVSATYARARVRAHVEQKITYIWQAKCEVRETALLMNFVRQALSIITSGHRATANPHTPYTPYPSHRH